MLEQQATLCAVINGLAFVNCMAAAAQTFCLAIQLETVAQSAIQLETVAKCGVKQLEVSASTALQLTTINFVSHCQFIKILAKCYRMISPEMFYCKHDQEYSQMKF